MFFSQPRKNQCLEPQGDSQSGVALIMAIFVLLVLSLLGLAMLAAASTEILINESFKRSRADFFGAEAGSEEARYRLGGNIDAGNQIAAPSSATSLVYIRSSASINPTDQSATNRYRDTEYSSITRRDNNGNVISLGSPGFAAPVYYPPLSGLSSPLPYSWAKITEKTEKLAAQDVDNDGTYNATDPIYYGFNVNTGRRAQYRLFGTSAGQYQYGTPVYLVTAQAADPTSGQRKIQTEITKAPVEPTPAAVDSYMNVDFNGNLTVSGTNECNPGSGDVAGVRSTGTVDTPNGSEHITGNPPILQNQPWEHNVPQSIDSLRSFTQPVDSSGTNVTCSGSPASCSGNNADLGTFPGTMKYYYSPGNLSLSSNSSHGYGLLLVNGDLTIHGGFTFDGLIVCNGTINFTGGGSHAINIHGAVIAAHSIDDTTTDLGGSINIQYNACYVTQPFQNMPMVVLSFKDRALY